MLPDKLKQNGGTVFLPSVVLRSKIMQQEYSTTIFSAKPAKFPTRIEIGLR